MAAIKILMILVLLESVLDLLLLLGDEVVGVGVPGEVEGGRHVLSKVVVLLEGAITHIIRDMGNETV